MKVLIIKMSSLGDVIHCLPAMQDLVDDGSELVIDWVVEEQFAPLLKASTDLHQVFTIGLRRWRKRLFSLVTWRELLAFRRRLREESYDLIIDAQGLIKSALVAKMARGPVAGFDASSAREPLAAKAYQQRIYVAKQQHAIDRLRQLFALAMKRPSADSPPDYGLSVKGEGATTEVMLVHGTTWVSKEWPVCYWVELATMIADAGLTPCLTWGNRIERQRCNEIVRAVPSARIMERMDLARLMQKIKGMGAVVAVDTGIGHLAAALATPVIALYGSTDPALTGIKSTRAVTLQDKAVSCVPCRKRTCQYQKNINDGQFVPPCYQSLTPQRVWEQLARAMDFCR
ncbi:MAG: lipopolysaccharide heptosyltransferase I [Gammaproteobacteria bacterium]|nr:lipopolysaccharide heptosyltransferase I [Gammaproteobacteria bacterium]